MPREKHHLFSAGDQVIYKGDDHSEWTPACLLSNTRGRCEIEISESRKRYHVSVRCLMHGYCQCDAMGEAVCGPCNTVVCSGCSKFHGSRCCYLRPIKTVPSIQTTATSGPKPSRRFSVVKEAVGEIVSPQSTPKLHPSPSLLSQQIKHRKKGLRPKFILVGAIVLLWMVFMFFVMSSHTMQLGASRFSSVQWSLESGALSNGNTILTRNTSVSSAQSICSSMEACSGFTFLKGQSSDGAPSEYLIFFKGWGAKKNDDPNWVSYMKDVSSLRNSGTQVETEIGKVLLTTAHGEIKISIRSPDAAEIICRSGLKNQGRSVFMRAEAVPANFGSDGFYGPPYALLQGTITSSKDSPGSSVGMCDFHDLKQNKFFTRPLIKPYTVWVIKTDHSSNSDSLHFFIALASHPEWEGNFEYLGNVDLVVSEEAISTIMHQETATKQWGQTTVQELKEQIPITVKWL